MHIMYLIIYNIIIYTIQPIIWIRLLWRSRQLSSYRDYWLERYGLCSRCIPINSVVIHAVSLGETLLAISLVSALQKRYPDIIITLTSMTPTGIALAQAQCYKSNNIYCRYLPYDLFGAMYRFVNQVQPRLVIAIETELWPNLINILYKRGVSFIVVNARMSCRSFIRYKKIRNFIALVMKQVTLIAAQNKKDAFRFFKLGCDKNKLFIMGNLKFDIEITQDLLNKVLVLKNTWIKKRQVWIASSTHVGEEFLLLKAHKKLLETFPDLLMILVPRHPERCVSVRNIIEKFGLSYIVRSSGSIPAHNVQVVVNDTIGELMLLYGIANIAFIGGSLVKHGGHNPLEAAAYAIPILMGPHVFNFSDVCMKLYKSGGLITVTDISSLVKIISMLLQDQQSCLEYGVRAFEVFKYNQGALQQLLYLLEGKIM